MSSVDVDEFYKTCPLRIQVNPKPYSTHCAGVACGWTGGHCKPVEECPERVEADKERQEIEDMILTSIDL